VQLRYACALTGGEYLSQRAWEQGAAGRTYPFWQQGSHPQGIEGAERLLEELAYIHLNPVKRGFVDEPENWRWSSARC